MSKNSSCSQGKNFELKQNTSRINGGTENNVLDSSTKFLGKHFLFSRYVYRKIHTEMMNLPQSSGMIVSIPPHSNEITFEIDEKNANGFLNSEFLKSFG